MKFFFDENIPKSAVPLLIENGHEVIDIRATSLEGSTDKVIFEMAQKEKAIFLTTDKDFFHTIPFLYDFHYGIIVISLRQPNRFKINQRIEWSLENFNLSDMKNKVILLKDDFYSIYE